ncbi:unnamed protein product [Ostreobium quekettii]|uniref:Uncharacterized protein n=1 Tax=Ostreobium quekettii TaxID=121088 RepID=A0A8S1JCT3_9CHLO|nr:unnamed protein product [Ostreobium quekettii]|eukprot:evm.model.scf_3136.2 EVM.evm.TU.scf_3136.2   scf_3136:9228-12923(+)
MDAGPRGRAPGQKGPAHRPRKAGRGAEQPGNRMASGMTPQGSTRVRDRKGQPCVKSGRHGCHQVDGRAPADLLGAAVPRGKRTGRRRRPRDLSRDFFVRELFSTVSVDTPKEREVAEALYSLANFFRPSAPPEDEGSADNRTRPHPQAATRRNNFGSTSRRRDAGIGARPAHTPADCRPPAVPVGSIRARRDAIEGPGSESDATDSDGESASWMDGAGAGERAARGGRIGRDMQRGRPAGGVWKRPALDGSRGNGESIGNSQMCAGGWESALLGRRRGDGAASAEEGFPHAKRTRTGGRKALGGEGRRHEAGHRVGEVGAKPGGEQKAGELAASQQQPSLKTLMDAFHGAYVRAYMGRTSLLGNVLNRPDAPKDQIATPGSDFSAPGLGGVGGTSAGLPSGTAAIPLSVAMDLHAMMQLGGLGGRRGSDPGRVAPQAAAVSARTGPVPASLKRSFARNCAHIHIAHFIRWHKYQLHQEGKTSLAVPPCSADGYAAGPIEAGAQPLQPQPLVAGVQREAKPQGQHTFTPPTQRLFPSMLPSHSLQSSTPLQAMLPVGEKVRGTKMSLPQSNSQPSSTHFPLLPSLHNGVAPTSVPTAGQPFTGPQGAAAFLPVHAPFPGGGTDASSSTRTGVLLSVLQAQCSRPPVPPAAVAGMGDVLGTGVAGGDMLRNQMARQLLMSMGSIHSSEGMNWLQYVATGGCAPDGKPLQLNSAASLGVVPSQFIPEGFK